MNSACLLGRQAEIWFCSDNHRYAKDQSEGGVGRPGAIVGAMARNSEIAKPGVGADGCPPADQMADFQVR